MEIIGWWFSLIESARYVLLGFIPVLGVEMRRLRLLPVKVMILKFLKTIIIRIQMEWRTIHKPFMTYSMLKHRNYKQKNQHSIIPMKANQNLEDTVYLKVQSDTTIVHYPIEYKHLDTC